MAMIRRAARLPSVVLLDTQTTGLSWSTARSWCVSTRRVVGQGGLVELKSSIAAVSVLGLSNADRLDLPEYVDSDSLTFRTPENRDRLNEPFTIAAVIVATAAALKGLVAYLAARSADRQETQIDYELEVTRQNGTKERHRIHVVDKGHGVSAELAKELGSLSGLPWQQLLPS